MPLHAPRCRTYRILFDGHDMGLAYTNAWSAHSSRRAFAKTLPRHSFRVVEVEA